MSTLVEMKCPACRPNAHKATQTQIVEFMRQLPKWHIATIDGVDRLRRVFKFLNFAEALEFTNKLGQLAEEHVHHPAILTEWGRTTVSWWTHTIKGLHKSDFIMAAKTDWLYIG